MALSSDQDHLFVVTAPEKKLDRLHAAICALGVQKALVFSGSQRGAVYLWKRLVEMKIPVGALSTIAVSAVAIFAVPHHPSLCAGHCAPRIFDQNGKNKYRERVPEGRLSSHGCHRHGIEGARL